MARVLKQRDGGRKLAHVFVEHSEIVEGLGQGLVDRPAPAECQCFFEQGLRFVIRAQSLVDPAHHSEHLSLQFWLAGKFLVNACGPSVQESSHGWLSRFMSDGGIRRSKQATSGGR